MQTFERQGFTHMVADGNDRAGIPLEEAKAFATNLWRDMQTAGFEVVATDTGGTSINKTTKKVLFRPTIAIDPLWGTDKWHVYFEIGGTAVMTDNAGQQYAVPDTGLYMVVGSDVQIPGVDTTKFAPGLSYYTYVPPRFNELTGPQTIVTGATQDYPRLSVKTPMAYRLTVVERGFVIGAWTQAITEDYRHMSVVCIQRGVGCDGTLATTNQKPLYMVTNTTPNNANFSGVLPGPKNLWFYSIVRESDSTVATPAWVTDQNLGSVNTYPFNTNMICDPTEAKGTALNYFPTRWYTPVTTDTGEYILMFPFGLCTNRFAFSDEIDLIAVSKADAYQHGQTVPINVYGEDREYTAYNSNNQSNGVNFDSGTRIFILTNILGSTP